MRQTPTKKQRRHLNKDYSNDYELSGKGSPEGPRRRTTRVFRSRISWLIPEVNDSQKFSRHQESGSEDSQVGPLVTVSTRIPRNETHNKVLVYWRWYVKFTHRLRRLFPTEEYPFRIYESRNDGLSWKSRPLSFCYSSFLSGTKHLLSNGLVRRDPPSFVPKGGNKWVNTNQIQWQRGRGEGR